MPFKKIIRKLSNKDGTKEKAKQQDVHPTPVREKGSMPQWKSGLEFKQPGMPKKQEVTTSRYGRRGPKKKGDFQQRNSGVDAPPLMSVVNAKPEIKKKATEQVAERAKKKEDKKRKMQARVMVNKPSPKQSKSSWSSVLSPTKSVSTLKMKGKKPAGYKPPPGSFKADWKNVYQDILSPSSGKPKMVAKQDLSNKKKLSSPKKRVQRKLPQKPTFPALDMDDDEVTDSKKPIRPVTPTQSDNVAASANDNDEYVDFDSEASSDYEVETEVKSMSLATKEETPNESTEMSMAKPQLILEFALKKDDGEGSETEPGVEVPVEVHSVDDMSSVGSWPSIASNDSYDTKMNKMMQRWIDLHGTDADDRTMYDNDVDLEDNVLDHFVLAAPDLEEAMAQFEEMSGIAPTLVGPLQGLGAKTAHIGLDENRYVEILAPDFDNPGPLGEELATLKKGTLTPYHYSIRSSEVSRIIEGYVYDVLGWDPDHIAMVQALPDKSIRHWDLLTMYGHDVGGAAPCYVKWRDAAQHPTASIALKASLTKFTVRAPENHDVHKLITAVGGLNIEYGEPRLECILSTPKGTLTFSKSNPKGLVFPGYEDDEQIHIETSFMPVSSDGPVDEDYYAVGSDSESSDTRRKSVKSEMSTKCSSMQS